MASSHTSIHGSAMGRPPCGSVVLVAGEGFEPSTSGVMGPGELPLLHPAALASRRGFEPRSSEPESEVLPLDEREVGSRRACRPTSCGGGGLTE